MPVRPKKRLGQHFLTDPDVVRAIVDAAAVPPGGRLVEIGPGEGALTGALLQRHPALVALEVDPEAVAHLRRRFPALDVRQADVLEADWGRLASGEQPAASGDATGKGPDEPNAASPPLPAPRSPLPLTVVGNLPYYITSPILFALLDARAHLGRAVVMVQKEVADRLAAPPGSKAYGTLSVYFGLYARTALLVDVPPDAFRPPPAVDSAVVTVDFRAADGRPFTPDVAWPALQATVRAAFGQRRKTLRNSLGALAAQAGRPVPRWAAAERPEALAPDAFVRLAHHFFDPAADALA